MRATINAELRQRETQLANYRINSNLGSQALVPLFTEIHVNEIDDENIPLMFAKANNAAHAPLYRNPESRDSDRHPGLLCLLPTPLKMGIHAVVIRQQARPNNYSPRLEWHMDKFDLLATEPETLVEQVPQAFSWMSPTKDLKERPTDPSTRVHMTQVGDVVTVIPTLTPNTKLQAKFEASIGERLRSRPESLDRRKELAPGILEIFQKDGLTLRATMDYLIGNHFATTANALSINPSVGKAVYTRFLRHLGNNGLQRLSKKVPVITLERHTRRLYNAIETMSLRTGYDMLHDPGGRYYPYQIAIDYDMARDLALAVLSGHTRLAGVGPSGIAVLRSMFSE